MKNIVIFGAGIAGQRAIEHYRARNDVRILCVTDNATYKHGAYIEGIPMIPPAAISSQPYDQVVIASMYHQQITHQLVSELSVPADKIDIISTNIQKGNIDFSDESRLGLGRKIMLAVCEELNREKIPYHIDHGTLLGLYRDGDILPWDNDIDLAIHIRDVESALAALEPLAVSFRSDFSTHNAWHCAAQTGPLVFDNESHDVIRILKFENADCVVSENVELDLIVKHPHNGRLHWLAGGVTTLVADEKYFSERTTRDYRGVPLSIPRETDAYLTELFGDWRLCLKEWNHSRYCNMKEAVRLLATDE